MTQLNDTAAASALVLCNDARTCQVIGASLQPLAIRPELCEDAVSASVLLDRQKFEAVIVDLRLGKEALLIMEQLRLSRTNSTAVTFAIADGTAPNLGARLDPTFVLQRPLSAASVNQTLRAAYGLIVRERRRYFRCPVTIPAYLRAPQEPQEFLCQSVNISEGGMAISSRTMPDSVLPAAVRFTLPGRSDQLAAETRVRWRGQAGLLGLEFQSLARPYRAELQEWLACRLEETLPENVAVLFRSVGQPPP